MAYLVLKFRVNPAVVDAEGDKVDLLSCHRAGIDRVVLGLEVAREFWSVMTSVALGEQGKVTTFVRRESGVEVLEEFPSFSVVSIRHHQDDH